MIYSRLSLSRIPRDSLKHFEISVPRDIRVAEVRKTVNQTTTFNKLMCNLTPEVRNTRIYKRNVFSTIFCYLLLDFHVKTGTRILLRYKLLFEISEFEITRVDCSQKAQSSQDTKRRKDVGKNDKTKVTYVTTEARQRIVTTNEPPQDGQ